MTAAITAEARLRARNQITVPAMVVDLLGAQHDDLLIFEANEHEPGTAVVRAVSRTGPILGDEREEPVILA